MNNVLAWDLGNVTLSEYDDDGFIGLQVTLHGDAPGCPSLESHAGFGHHARPLDPDVGPDGVVGRGCQALYAWEGDRGHVWALQDPRVTEALPKYGKGGSIHYGARKVDGGYLAPFALFDELGSWTLYVPYAPGSDGKATKAATIQVAVGESGQESIQILHGEGSTIQLLHDGSVYIANKSATSTISLKADGTAVITGPTIAASGMTIGAPAGAIPLTLAAPLQAWIAITNTLLSSLLPASGVTSAQVSAWVAASQAIIPQLAATKASAL